MSDEINDFQEQLDEVLAELDTLLHTTLPKISPQTARQARLEKCEYAKNRLGRAKQLLKSIQVELRELPRIEAKPYEVRCKEYDDRITKLSDDLNWIVTATDEVAAPSSAGKTPNGSGGPAVIGAQSSAKELVDAAKRIQQESKESTTRTKQQLQHTIEIGASTNAKLKEQTQQLEGVDKKVEQIDDNLKRADKQIRIFMRRMATDKVVLALVLMVVLGIIGAIVAHYIKNPNVSF